MPFISVNPATGRRIGTHRAHSQRTIEEIVSRAHAAFGTWRTTTLAARARTLRAIAKALRREQEPLAALITAEVGKPIAQSRAEVAKSALACDYYAEHGRRWLAPAHPPGAPKNTAVHFEPLGPVLAVMPWNFPIWQAMRAIAPALVAGDTFL
ncbi:MAG TPA: aldehyde dehydrogenase family protein, partial [Opitutus sp.]|nr:aldehyde dehydrogenase family protein [Opitutus sp.]